MAAGPPPTRLTRLAPHSIVPNWLGIFAVLMFQQISGKKSDLTVSPAISVHMNTFLRLGPLQTLINAAAPGATINVPDGTYTEAITIGDGKTLSGSGPDNVVIDASNLGGPAITASGDFSLIGIRVTGGAADNGGGIFADIAGTNISLDNVVFNGNGAVFDGGAIYLRDGTLSGTNTGFVGNAAGGNGGAIFSGTSATISGSQFQDNSAGQNGGAIASQRHTDIE